MRKLKPRKFNPLNFLLGSFFCAVGMWLFAFAFETGPSGMDISNSNRKSAAISASIGLGGVTVMARELLALRAKNSAKSEKV
jgi:hypothetical protein